MQTSGAGRAVLELREGLQLKAYQDARGIWTIGYGHTGPEVKRGLVWTQAQADQALSQDLAWVEAELRPLSLTPGQFDACVSLVYNIGALAFHNSTLRKYLVLGKTDAAAMEFMQWKRAGSDPDLLLRRRTAELIQFVRG